jgi:hypothetical protein
LAFSFFELVQAQKAQKGDSKAEVALKKSWPPTEAAVKHKKLKAVKSD